MELTTAQTYTDSAGKSYVIHRLLNDDNGDCILAFCALASGADFPQSGDLSDPTVASDHPATGFAKGCVLIETTTGKIRINTDSTDVANFGVGYHS